jgi:hypothetical protein
MYPHRIRLRGPWESEPLGDSGNRVRFRRRFGRPRRLDPGDVVWLTFVGLDTAALVTLNGRLLGRHEQGPEPFEFEVTELLRERNELLVDLEAVSGNRGEVALEVRASAFLRQLSARSQLFEAKAQLHIHGEAVGTSDRPLDLYVLLDRSTIAYRTILPTPAGEPFDLVCVADASLGTLQVELVNGAVIWYSAACPLA